MAETTAVANNTTIAKTTTVAKTTMIAKTTIVCQWHAQCTNPHCIISVGLQGMNGPAAKFVHHVVAKWRNLWCSKQSIPAYGPISVHIPVPVPLPVRVPVPGPVLVPVPGPGPGPVHVSDLALSNF